MTGSLRIEAVLTTLDKLDGSRADLDKITKVIEPIFRKLNPVKKHEQK